MQRARGYADLFDALPRHPLASVCAALFNFLPSPPKIIITSNGCLHNRIFPPCVYYHRRSSPSDAIAGTRMKTGAMQVRVAPMATALARRFSSAAGWMPPREDKAAMKERLAKAQKAAASPPSLQGVKPHPVNSAAVVGSGTMGAGIAMCFAGVHTSVEFKVRRKFWQHIRRLYYTHVLSCLLIPGVGSRLFSLNDTDTRVNSDQRLVFL